MVVGMYNYIAESWKRLYKEKNDILKQRIVAARREHAIVRVDKPSRLDRARALGYKAKQGFIVVRVRVSKGGMRRKRARAGRRPKHIGVVKIKQAESMKRVAERRVAERYPNMEVRGSYYLFEDGRYYWFECILVDKSHPAVKNDRELRHQLVFE
ncbi:MULTISPECIES: 50S ribosomal protein L15e [Candidatus Nitrosocaldus]|jgi:large subunit ribosomal protein L15e|uniref:50S ribosomal protein L15e n=1 Tax=Candidatus Nitrosocaldus cavascurensis TaxID=2058097 RepID=A0A2K5AS69_9ARCH|nr:MULTISPECIES: 50S ribosomal protein L15e [Candidatus Nitrosocaldus]SPC34459.1 50S ribosomal protein L15e [Candidatus Nitrosocaldus cavascurensis]